MPDLEERRLLPRFERVLKDGVVEVLATAFHHYLIPCPPLTPSKRFDKMQQLVTIAPLREDGRIRGLIVTVETSPNDASASVTWRNNCPIPMRPRDSTPRKCCRETNRLDPASRCWVH